MRPSAGRIRQKYPNQRSIGWTGPKLVCCVAALFLLVSQVSPARQKHRRLGEDTALSAALNGLPVSPSASSGMSGVNVYGLDNSLLAALQGKSDSSSSNAQSSNAPQAPAGAPTSQPAKLAKPAPGQGAVISQPVNGSAGLLAVPARPAVAPQSSASPPRSNVTPLDPLLAAALENQGRVSAPTVSSRAPYGRLAPAMAPASAPVPAPAPAPAAAAPVAAPVQAIPQLVSSRRSRWLLLVLPSVFIVLPQCSILLL